MHLLDWFIWFVFYSFAGWAYESLLFTIQEKRFVNRGFLNGPLCPIYGIGGLLLIWMLSNRTNNLFLLFFVALILTTALEYLTAILLEKLFNAKWWDYSMFPLNLHGRISLFSSIVFALMAVVVIRYVQPLVQRTTDSFSLHNKMIFTYIFSLYLFIDLSVTVRHVLILNGRLSELQNALNCFFGKYYKRAGEYTAAIIVNFEESEFYTEHIKILINLDRMQNRRIFRAFPRLRSIKYDDALKKLKTRLLGPKDGGGE